jgi:hypothetical protein
VHVSLKNAKQFYDKINHYQSLHLSTLETKRAKMEFILFLLSFSCIMSINDARHAVDDASRCIIAARAGAKNIQVGRMPDFLYCLRHAL